MDGDVTGLVRATPHWLRGQDDSVLDYILLRALKEPPRALDLAGRAARRLLPRECKARVSSHLPKMTHPSNNPSDGSGRIRELDGLRALAILQLRIRRSGACKAISKVAEFHRF